MPSVSVRHFANLHLGAATPNFVIQESIRNRYRGWHADLVTDAAGIENGRLQLPEGPGLGTELADEVLEAEDVTRRVTGEPAHDGSRTSGN